MQEKLRVLSVTDPNKGIGKVIVADGVRVMLKWFLREYKYGIKEVLLEIIRNNLVNSFKLVYGTKNVHEQIIM